MTPTLMGPLELIYAAAVRAKNAFYDRAKPRRLRFPVISVGNLSVGGAGKSPLVIRLAQLLEREGFYPDVLSRGYGRRGTAAERVDAEGDAQRYGDEPIMIARATGVPVYVGASRYEAGLLAEREISARAGRIHLLDDGFQHRDLARAVDIVVIHRNDLHERLLPLGRLREPRTSLKRADVIVVREEDAELAAKLGPYVESSTVFWNLRRTLSLPESGKRAVAFCGIARPDEFFQGLEGMGKKLVGKMSFRDHHRYTVKDIEELRKLGARQKCEQFITTEKDAVKLSTELRERLVAIAPLEVAVLELELADEAAKIRQLIGMVDSPEVD